MIKNRYVYLHLDTSGIIRYVGSGTSTESDTPRYKYVRAYQRINRSTTWTEFFADIEPQVLIIEENLNDKDAISLENYMYHSCKDTLLNVTEPRPVIDLDFELFNEWFYVDESSPSCLRLKKKHPKNTSTNVGEPVGHISKSGTGKEYWKMKLHSKSYQAHRIVYLLSNGVINSNKVINHIDGNGLNNKLSNLEEVSFSLNSIKTKLKSHNNTGYAGISKTYYKNQLDGYVAKFKKICKRFSFIAFGSDATALAAALRWRKYQECVSDISNVEDFKYLQNLVIEDCRKSQAVRSNGQAQQFKNGSWYLKFKYKKSDSKYTMLKGYPSKEAVESERDRLIEEYNNNLVISII